MNAPPVAVGPAAAPKHSEHQTFWLWVMCLTGVDYFSTLGYQPSIAFEATGRLAPLATVLLVFVTLCCALPTYWYVAGQSPHGQGSIAMLERLLTGWPAKILVLILLGFAATDFVITKTLSAADAAEHLVHNPYWKRYAVSILHNQILVTMFLLVMLGAMFLRGFREVIGIAVVIVTVYLTLNAIIVGSGLWYLVTHPSRFADWYQAVAAGDWRLEHSPLRGHDPAAILATCVLFFPKLALGLSGFETGVAVMPLIRGEPNEDPERPAGRIRGARYLLLTSAVIMSAFLLGSATVTSMLIPPEELLGGLAQNRALAFVAHGQTEVQINPLFGTVFGTLYDASTVAILWFAGASAMSGLLNLVPRYLPRFGMAPRWAEAIRPLVCLFTAINLLVTWIFEASVVAQGGAYATGVLVLMTSACVATVIDRWNKGSGNWIARLSWPYVLITLVFAYTTTAVVIEKPDGIKIAGTFIVTVVVFSLVSRLRRSTELRFDRFQFVDQHSRLLWDSIRHLEFPVLVPHRPGHHGIAEKDEKIRRIHRLGAEIPVVFVEATLGDPSEFHHSPLIEIGQQEGRFVLRLTRCVSIPHALAAVALELAKSGKPPELHFGWSDENPLAANISFLLFGEGNIPWLVRELLHRAQPDPARRPRVIIG